LLRAIVPDRDAVDVDGQTERGTLWRHLKVVGPIRHGSAVQYAMPAEMASLVRSASDPEQVIWEKLDEI
jgi:hypothetical protein